MTPHIAEEAGQGLTPRQGGQTGSLALLGGGLSLLGFARPFRRKK